jgi:hypothetical protein
MAIRTITDTTVMDTMTTTIRTPTAITIITMTPPRPDRARRFC